MINRLSVRSGWTKTSIRTPSGRQFQNKNIRFWEPSWFGISFRNRFNKVIEEKGILGMFAAHLAVFCTHFDFSLAEKRSQTVLRGAIATGSHRSRFRSCNLEIDQAITDSLAIILEKCPRLAFYFIWRAECLWAATAVAQPSWLGGRGLM